MSCSCVNFKSRVPASTMLLNDTMNLLSQKARGNFSEISLHSNSLSVCGFPSLELREKNLILFFSYMSVCLWSV